MACCNGRGLSGTGCGTTDPGAFGPYSQKRCTECRLADKREWHRTHPTGGTPRQRAPKPAPEPPTAIVFDPVADATPDAPTAPVVAEAARAVREHAMLTQTLAWLRAGNVLLVGPAGCGKTTLVEQAAQRLGLTLYVMGAVAFQHELTGFVDANGNYVCSPLRAAFEHGGLLLLDEMDASSPAALLTMNAALANGYMTFPDSPLPIKRHESFRCVATANTFGKGADREYTGRAQLDASTPDRFTILECDYDESIEREIGEAYPEWVRHVHVIRRNVRSLKMRHVVSTRAIVRGCSALADGTPFDEVSETLLRRDLSTSDWARVAA